MQHCLRGGQERRQQRESRDRGDEVCSIARDEAGWSDGAASEEWRGEPGQSGTPRGKLALRVAASREATHEHGMDVGPRPPSPTSAYLLPHSGLSVATTTSPALVQRGGSSSSSCYWGDGRARGLGIRGGAGAEGRKSESRVIGGRPTVLSLNHGRTWEAQAHPGRT